MSHIAASPQPKEYSPQSHGDTEKSKLKGNTGAHGGGGGHGENPRGAQRFSALVTQEAFRRGACFSLPRRAELAPKTLGGCPLPPVPLGAARSEEDTA